MTNSGKKLEGLVAFVEKTLLPQGFEVKTNQHVLDEDGVQIAEFDIEAKGKLGSTEIAWLIECRDRPSQGPAPGSWIEQLVGRRSRFGFNKVTAVSTTGFAKGAEEYAEKEGIELREVRALEPKYFSDWLQIGSMTLSKTVYELKHARLDIDPEETEERKKALRELIGANKLILRAIKTGESVEVNNAFLAAVSENTKLAEDLVPNGPGKPVKLYVNYTNDNDHYVVDTNLGAIRIKGIAFKGELSLKETKIPVETTQYHRTGTEEVISQVAAFPFEVEDKNVAVEIHRMPDSEYMHVLLRNAGKKSK